MWQHHLKTFNLIASICMFFYGTLLVWGQHWLWDGVMLSSETWGVKEYDTLDSYLTTGCGWMVINCGFLYLIMSTIPNNIISPLLVYTNFISWLGWTLFDIYYREHYTPLFWFLNNSFSHGFFLYSTYIMYLLYQQ